MPSLSIISFQDTSLKKVLNPISDLEEELRRLLYGMQETVNQCSITFYLQYVMYVTFWKSFYYRWVIDSLWESGIVFLFNILRLPYKKKSLNPQQEEENNQVKPTNVKLHSAKCLERQHQRMDPDQFQAKSVNISVFNTVYTWKGQNVPEPVIHFGNCQTALQCISERYTG